MVPVLVQAGLNSGLVINKLDTLRHWQNENMHRLSKKGKRDGHRISRWTLQSLKVRSTLRGALKAGDEGYFASSLIQWAAVLPRRKWAYVTRDWRAVRRKGMDDRRHPGRDHQNIYAKLTKTYGVANALQWSKLSWNRDEMAVKKEESRALNSWASPPPEKREP